MLEKWYTLTAPITVWEHASVEQKIRVLRGQCLSIASIFLVVNYLLLGVIEKLFVYGTVAAMLVCVFVYVLNKNGKVQLAASLLLFEYSCVCAYILIVRGETTGIGMLILSFVISTFSLPPKSNIFLLLLNSAILLVYMSDMGQLMTNLMWTRILTQTMIGVAAYLGNFLVQHVLIQASDLQSTVNKQKSLEVRNTVLESEKLEIDGSLNLIREGISNFENRQSKARIDIVTKKNRLKDISAIINTLLSKQEKLQRNSLELERTRQAALVLANLIAQAKETDHAIVCQLTETVLDPVIIELKNRKVGTVIPKRELAKGDNEWKNF